MTIFKLFISHTFRIILIFFLVFIWFRFFENKLLLDVIFSSVLTFAMDIIISTLDKKRTIKSLLKNEEIKKAEGFCNYFIFNNQSISVKFCEQLITNHQTTKYKNYIKWNSESGLIILYPYFTYDNLTIKELISIFNNVKQYSQPQKIIICTKNYDKSTNDFAQKLPIKVILLNQYEFYQKLMKPNNIFPNESITINTNSKTTNIVDSIFNRRKTKAYFFSSILILLSSFFVKVTIYYLIISSILLIMTILSFIKKEQKNTPDNILT